MIATAPEPLDAVSEPLVRVLQRRAAEHPDELAYAVFPRGATSPTQHITWAALHDDARALAARMLSADVRHGDRVVILAGNRPLWPVADMACQMIGAIGVGVFPSSAPAQVRAIMEDSHPVVALADTADATLLLSESGTALGLPTQVVGTGTAHFPTWESWLGEGREALAGQGPVRTSLRQRMADVTLDDIAALIYTSGSTGEPKGAMISHRYLAASARSIATVLELDRSDSTVSFLPFSHAAERVFGQCTRVHVGMSSALVEDPSEVFRVCAAFEPTLFGGLPRIFERLYEAVELARRAGDDPYDAIVQRIGRRCRTATSGGAALPSRVSKELASLGLSVLGAYGQTEHLCIAMHRRGSGDDGTVGLPMPGTELRIAPDGEIQVRRSALTFSGYLNKPGDTADAFTPDGEWLRTGDRGEIDDAGRLRITGRAKELIALSTGRKIAPSPIEATLASSPFIAHAICHGEGHKSLVALLSLRRAVVESWAKSQGFPDGWPALAHHPALRLELQEAVDRVNEGLARTDRIRDFAVTEAEFTMESGELTPTLKPMRSVIASRYSHHFHGLHST